MWHKVQNTPAFSACPMDESLATSAGNLAPPEVTWDEVAMLILNNLKRHTQEKFLTLSQIVIRHLTEGLS